MVQGGDRSVGKLGLTLTLRLLMILFVAIIFVAGPALAAALQTYYFLAEASFPRVWNAESNAAAAAIEKLVHSPRGVTPDTLDVVRRQHGIARLEWRRGNQSLAVGGPYNQTYRAYRRDGTFGWIEVSFSNNEPLALRQSMRMILFTGLALVASGIIVFGLYLYSVGKPMEEMLGHARELRDFDSGVDETWYLIDTFRGSIKTLKEQEQELKRLHSLEKSRADDLARVASTLTRSISSGVIAFDEDGAIYDLNDAARSILGLTEGLDVIGRTSLEVFGDNPFSTLLQRAISNRSSLQRQELDLVTNQELTIGLSTVPLINDQARYLGMIALFTDLTPVRQLEQRLREMQTLADLGETSAGIAHEFRNSLSTIMGYLRLASRSTSPEAAERLKKAEAEAAQLSAAVTALLNFARPMTLERHEIEVSELLQSLAARLADTSDEVEFTFRGVSLQIEGDSTLLGRAFENLLRNAVDAIRQKGSSGTVTIEIEDDPPLIRIRDNGVGLDPASVSRLLLPFQSDKPSGFGIGLALARKIILLHGGTLTLDGEPGVGAVVTVTFDRAALEESVPEPFPARSRTR